MQKIYWHIARLPVRWRLALVSFGLLVVLQLVLGTLISLSEEQALFDGQYNTLHNDARILRDRLQVTKSSLTIAQILSFPEMTSNIADIYITDIQSVMGQDIHVSLLSFNGNVLATDAQPMLTLERSNIEHWLAQSMPPSYILANNNHGQRELVALEPLSVWDKQAGSTSNVKSDLSGYRKAILQLSVSTASTDQTVAVTRLMLILGILGTLSIAAALTLPLINIALRPLVEMERVSTRIAAGALSLRLEEPPAHDEIGHMARAFNSMVSRLEAVFARQKRFVADVSHELRTPLTGIGGSLEMLLLGADAGDEQITRRLVVGMYNEVERMQRLVADLLALSRLDEGGIKLHMGPVSLQTLIGDVCSQVQGMIHEQQLYTVVPANLPPVHGDRDQLHRVLLNIVENALKFTPSAGRIDIVASRDNEEHVIVKIRDTGMGIPPEALPYVFDRFYRADPARSRTHLRPGGSGLGLSLAKELIEAHDGTITIHSVVGQGTTVTVRVPTLRIL